MNWLTNFIRPKIRSIVEQKEVPDNLWQKCPSCDGMLFHRDLAESLNVCSHCGHHMRISAEDRLNLLFDNGKYRELTLPKVAFDPLKFKDRKKYNDRLRDTRSKTGRQDALIIAEGTVGSLPVVIAALDFSFMGGSMGAAMGEGIVTAAQAAVSKNAAFIIIPTSGGARMQEGMISLMQMPRTIIAAEMVKDAGLPYIVMLTDPTTGGVSASFAMVGDIHIAEPGCMIGFAGKRVIQETIREELPEGFQTAEYLLDHGMVDMVVPRKDLRDTLIRILDLLLNKTRKYSAGKDDAAGGKSAKAGAKAGNNNKKPGNPARAMVSKTKPKSKPANTNKPRAKKTARKS
ncbi:MAG: acetyl-CoA carboxylase carboxyltransferase subunit beta [Rhodospirillales bacterium]|nr:acetyl-CoA carboxylase carboxyltransferase subunit beta [Rhodospirillales bacterium]MCB9996088.1 acetyl-CoA carboxylase carboxyltransferase subunit beta [Rhodospirillales bacterium]